MSKDNEYRNLLFGLLALRIDFITHSELIHAICLRQLEPQRNLGDLLASQGVLYPDTCRVLEAVVEEHVHKHGGSLAKSLASLGPIDPELKTTLEALEFELPAELTRVPSSVQAAGWIRRHHHWLVSGAVTGTVAILVAATIVAMAPQSRDTTLAMIGLIGVVMIAVLSGLVLVGIPYLIGLAFKSRWNRRLLKSANLSPRDREKAVQVHFDEITKHLDSGAKLIEKLIDDPAPRRERLADLTVHFVKSCFLVMLIVSAPCTVVGFFAWRAHPEVATFFFVSLGSLLVSAVVSAILAGPDR